jgi:histidine triad (HIT) family protein
MNMAGIFARIASGEIPSYKIAENERFFSFLDINPITPGHVLVIPKQEVDYIFDLDTELYREFWDFAAKVARAIKQAVPCVKVGIAVIGLEVPHAHIHLVPMNTMGDIDFTKKKLSLPKEQMQDLAARIAQLV